jgi:hypothetical protein
MNEEEKQNETQAGPKLDWKPLFGAFKQASEWALDAAAQFARDYPEEVAAVERVRMFLRQRVASSFDELAVVDISIDDVLFTLGLLIGVIERDRGKVGQFGDWLEQMPLLMPNASEIDRHCLELLAGTYETVQTRIRAAA